MTRIVAYLRENWTAIAIGIPLGVVLQRCGLVL